MTLIELYYILEEFIEKLKLPAPLHDYNNDE